MPKGPTLPYNCGRPRKAARLKSAYVSSNVNRHPCRAKSHPRRRCPDRDEPGVPGPRPGRTLHQPRRIAKRRAIVQFVVRVIGGPAGQGNIRIPAPKNQRVKVGLSECPQHCWQFSQSLVDEFLLAGADGPMKQVDIFVGQHLQIVVRAFQCARVDEDHLLLVGLRHRQPTDRLNVGKATGCRLLKFCKQHVHPRVPIESVIGRRTENLLQGQQRFAVEPGGQPAYAVASRLTSLQPGIGPVGHVDEFGRHGTRLVGQGIRYHENRLVAFRPCGQWIRQGSRHVVQIRIRGDNQGGQVHRRRQVGQHRRGSAHPRRLFWIHQVRDAWQGRPFGSRHTTRRGHDEGRGHAGRRFGNRSAGGAGREQERHTDQIRKFKPKVPSVPDCAVHLPVHQKQRHTVPRASPAIRLPPGLARRQSTGNCLCGPRPPRPAARRLWMRGQVIVVAAPPRSRGEP